MKKTYMLQEIREQPHVLRRARDAALSFLETHDPGLLGMRSIRLVGCGDMNFSARTAAWLTRDQGPQVQAHRSMDMRWQAARLGPQDLVVAASFSGRTPRTQEAARLARGCGARVWGITGNRTTPLTSEVDEVLVLPTGPEEELARHTYAGYHHIVPQTKTFTAVLMAEAAAAGCSGLPRSRECRPPGKTGPRSGAGPSNAGAANRRFHGSGFQTRGARQPAGQRTLARPSRFRRGQAHRDGHPRTQPVC